jgi:hypothetical protein
MQASGSLSAVQREALELAFTSLKGFTAFLESVQTQAQSRRKIYRANLS